MVFFKSLKLVVYVELAPTKSPTRTVSLSKKKLELCRVCVREKEAPT